MSENLKTIGFIFILCSVCSLLLTAGSAGLKDFQQKNIVLDKQKNILKSVGILNKVSSKKEIESLYNDKIKNFWVDLSGNLILNESKDLIPLYVFLNEKEIDSYIIPFDVKGLWGKIKGYIAIDNDGTHVRGFTVYNSSETPGLGGEIEKSWFQNNFINKKIIDDSGKFVSVVVSKGKTPDGMSKNKKQNYVDGISGATLTGKFLTTGIRETLSQYELYSSKLRANKDIKILPQTSGKNK
ncbi:MAG: FMN-binding protein [Desulfobacterales bacterium]|nr:FMN-binding protein [Desulfobacterales bacterium]